MIYEKNKTKNISFPLGGIGSGCIGLAGNGELIDWEIFNRPNKNTRNGYSHFAIKATCDGKSVAKVLHGDTNENLIGTACASKGHYGMGYGPRENSLAGFPHFESVTFEGNFPIANLTFTDKDFPAAVRLCAFNPFIPHDEFNSSLPVAFFEWEIENVTDKALKIDLACTVCNPARVTRNTEFPDGRLSGVILGCDGISADEVEYRDLCVLTDSDDCVVQEYWYRGAWKDGCTMYWRNFSDLERMPRRHYDAPHKNDCGTVVSYTELAPKAKAKLRFVIAWNVPNVHNYWRPLTKDGQERPTWRNYYATQFAGSSESAKYALDKFNELYDKTLALSNALEACTLPKSVKDAVSANLSVIKTPTALRLEDGSFWGWEGCSETVGSCEGTCQHVWNYAYAMPYLFPRLERSIRENTIKYALFEGGATSFRITLPPVKEMFGARACVDGQMGEVIKFYREWKLSGNDKWFSDNVESIFKMLEYAWSPENPDKWDSDFDGVLEGRQHHTLDMELFGPSSWLQGFYLLALDCAAEMADYIGDNNRSKLYKKLYQNGRTWMNENLFNGKYFCQKVELTDKSLVEQFDAVRSYWNEEAGEIKYQVADGCIIDQMLADWHAALIGKNGVFDTDKKRTALKNLYKNNYKDSMRDVANMWRNFSLNDEAGTVICSYPDGVKLPAIPIPYCEETMTGFEYSLAGLMISEGFVAEGEKMVKAIRDRYDGEKRNPWNEIECGSNYARSMASYALMPIYSGFSFDMTRKHIGFAPIGENGKYLFSVCESWGTVEIDKKKCQLSVLGNSLTLNSIFVPNAMNITSVIADGKNVEFSFDGEKIVFDNLEIKESLILIK